MKIWFWCICMKINPLKKKRINIISFCCGSQNHTYICEATTDGYYAADGQGQGALPWSWTPNFTYSMPMLALWWKAHTKWFFYSHNAGEWRIVVVDIASYWKY